MLFRSGLGIPALSDLTAPAFYATVTKFLVDRRTQDIMREHPFFQQGVVDHPQHILTQYLQTAEIVQEVLEIPVVSQDPQNDTVCLPNPRTVIAGKDNNDLAADLQFVTDQHRLTLASGYHAHTKRKTVYDAILEHNASDHARVQHLKRTLLKGEDPRLGKPKKIIK